MSIGHAITRGFGTGTFAGDVNLLVTSGYLGSVSGAPAHVITKGFGNGTFAGDINLVITSGYLGGAPSFTGTIPNIEESQDTGTHQTDLSSYFTGATSYSILPSVETGWTFNTSTGVLTIDTDDIGTFGTYVVTGTNAAGSDDSNAFSVIVSEADDEVFTGGFWLAYEREIHRRDEQRIKRLKEKGKERKRIIQIEDNLHKQLALEEAQIKEEDERRLELEMINKVVSNHKEQIDREFSDNLLLTVNRAIMKSNYSSLEALERQLKEFKEEEEFMIVAAKILLNQ